VTVAAIGDVRGILPRLATAGAFLLVPRGVVIVDKAGR
jgi:hypothetical protein